MPHPHVATNMAPPFHLGALTAPSRHGHPMAPANAVAFEGGAAASGADAVASG
jgi:hypothetical protein